MRTALFIARRYLFSKKSTHAINVISLISVVGVAVATTALVVTLSVFNGFHDLVASLFTAFDPQLTILPAKGKTAPADSPELDRVRSLQCVQVATDVVEDQAMAVYRGRQAMVRIKGVADNFDSLTHIRSILLGDGEYELHAGDLDYGIPGVRLADDLGTGIRYHDPLKVYAPERRGQLDMGAPEEAFVEEELYSPGVVFCVKQAKYDKNVLLTGISFARRLFSCQGELTSLELRLRPGADIAAAKREIQQAAGPAFRVLDRYEQQSDTFRIMRIEKLIAYIFLTFILVVACFNIIGSLSMLIIDKEKDIATLSHLGASRRLIKRIFLFEGRMISAIGAVIGIVVGLILCWLQQTFGIVALGQSAGSFIVDAYPVSVHPTDIIVILLTVVAVGFIAVWYPVHSYAQVDKLTS